MAQQHEIKVGDRVKIIGGFGGKGEVGTVTSKFGEQLWNAWWVKTNSGTYDKWGSQLELVPSTNVKSDVFEMAQRNRDAMLDEIDNFRKAVENGTLGDFSELGFLANLLQALVKS